VGSEGVQAAGQLGLWCGGSWLSSPRRTEAAALGDGAPDTHAPVSEVNVGPLEGQEFPLPHPGVDGEHIQSFEPVALGGSQHRPHLISRER